MSRTREPSYYEVALTNRQVLVAFAILLGCVLAAFLAGVWVGQDATPADFEMAGQTTPAKPAGAEVPSLDLFAGEVPAASEPPSLDPAPRPGTTLAEDLGAEPASPPSSEAAVPAPPDNGKGPSAMRYRQRVAHETERRAREFERESGAGEAQPAAAPEAPARPAPADPVPVDPVPVEPVPAEPAPRQPGPPAGAGGRGFVVVQVLSTADQAKARQTLSSLQDGGYPATLSTLEREGRVLYRVRLGPYEDRPAADKVADEVRRKFRLDTWITSE